MKDKEIACAALITDRAGTTPKEPPALLTGRAGSTPPGSPALLTDRAGTTPPGPPFERAGKNEQAPGAWASTWITLVFGISAVFAVGFGVTLILGREDNEALESPLLLSVARQLIAGPWELYGPFGARNPLVLIHAPLYYHTAALAAWPLTRLGLDPISAARLAGRFLSFAGLVITAIAAYRLARLDGAPARAGWWAVCLIATAPVIGVMPYSVRPDMLGVALQTIGVFLVLRRLQSDDSRIGGVSAAFAAFGLAACIKQQYIVAPIFSTALLLVAWRRGRVALRIIVRTMVVAVALVLIVYGAEELATAGRMSQAVFGAAARTSRVHPADWGRAEIVIFAIVGRSSGWIALLAAAGLAQLAVRRELGTRLFVLTGIALVLLIVIRAMIEPLWKDAPGAIPALCAVCVCLCAVIPACAVLDRRAFVTGRIESVLWIFLLSELAVATLMSRQHRSVGQLWNPGRCLGIGPLGEGAGPYLRRYPASAVAVADRSGVPAGAGRARPERVHNHATPPARSQSD